MLIYFACYLLLFMVINVALKEAKCENIPKLARKVSNRKIIVAINSIFWENDSRIVIICR